MICPNFGFFTFSVAAPNTIIIKVVQKCIEINWLKSGILMKELVVEVQLLIRYIGGVFTL